MGSISRPAFSGESYSLLGVSALANPAHAQQSPNVASIDAAKHGSIAPTTYRITHLSVGADPAGSPFINASGQVAFAVSTDHFGPVYTYFYDGKTFRNIGTLGNAFTTGVENISQASAINDAGLIAATSATAAYNYHAFAWTRSTGMVDIDTLASRYLAPVAVGAKEQVAGNLFVNGGHTRAFAWTRTGGMRDIGTAGFDDAWMVGMSASGQVTGILTSEGQYGKAMTWTRDGGMPVLGTFWRQRFVCPFGQQQRAGGGHRRSCHR